MTIIEYQDVGYSTNFCPGGTIEFASNMFSPMSDFPYAAAIDVPVMRGLSQLQDFTLDGTTWMGGDVLHICFCGSFAPWTTLMGDNYSDTDETDFPNPFTGTESPIYILEFPPPGTSMYFGRAALVFAATAQRQIAQINACVGSMNKYQVAIVCGDGTDLSPFDGAGWNLPPGSSVAAAYPSSCGTLSLPRSLLHG